MLVVGGALDPALAADANVVVLTQTPCQFLESESGVDRKFRSRRAEDCEAVNQRTGAARIAEATPLQLKPGRYVFRVTNKNVPYELGFWLREHDYSLSNPLHKVTKISVSGGGLALGTTKDYVVDLKPGQYVYSCPLNPTPNYRLVVRE
jgi:hypothetical protein